MSEWVQNEVYDYFGKNPIIAINMYKQKDTKTLISIVVKYINECPSEYYDNDYRHCWKTQEYVDILQIWLKHNTKPHYVT